MCVPSPPSLGARLHPPRPLVLLHAACGGVARAAGARAAVALRAAALPARARAVPRAVGRDAGRGESASGGGLIAHWLEKSQGSRRGLSGPAPGQSERLTLSVGLGYTPRRREVARNAGLACMSWATYDQHAQHFGLVHGGGHRTQLVQPVVLLLTLTQSVFSAVQILTPVHWGRRWPRCSR